MPVVRFVNAVVWAGKDRVPGETLAVSDADAWRLCEGYHDAVRVDGTVADATASGFVGDVVQTRDPVAQHRDPVVPPPKRRGG